MPMPSCSCTNAVAAAPTQRRRSGSLSSSISVLGWMPPQALSAAMLRRRGREVGEGRR